MKEWLLASALMCFSVTAVAERVINIDLSLAANLRQYADRNWTVFVFAKPLDGRVPVASKKLLLSQLPMRVQLTEANFLLKGLTLASQDKVTVTAKAVRHDSPHKTVVGDLLGPSPLVDFSTADEQQVRLQIDSEVK